MRSFLLWLLSFFDTKAPPPVRCMGCAKADTVKTPIPFFMFCAICKQGPFCQSCAEVHRRIEHTEPEPEPEEQIEGGFE